MQRHSLSQCCICTHMLQIQSRNDGTDTCMLACAGNNTKGCTWAVSRARMPPGMLSLVLLLRACCLICDNIASTSINTMLRHLYCMTLPTCTHMPPLSNRLPVAGFTRKNKFTIMTRLQPRHYDAYTLAVHDAAYMHPHASTQQ